MIFFSGKYKVQIFNKDTNDYVPTPHGIGMHVEVKDPEQKVLLSKVTTKFHFKQIKFIYYFLFKFF